MPNLTDEPIDRFQDDLLDRADYASGLIRIIDEWPRPGSVRIGVYGDWGEGKSSVLRLMEKELHAKRYRTTWVLPWVAVTTEELRSQLLGQVARALGLRNRWWLEAAGWVSARVAQHARRSGRPGLEDARCRRRVRRHRGGRRQRASASPDSEISSGGCRPRCASRHSWCSLTISTGPSRISFPQFLMALRDALDFPNLFYVVAVSPKILEQGLASQHAGWSEPHKFLEKVIEYPTFLPDIPAPTLQGFLKRHVADLGDRVSINAIESLTSVLPRQPPNPEAASAPFRLAPSRGRPIRPRRNRPAAALSVPPDEAGVSGGGSKARRRRGRPRLPRVRVLERRSLRRELPDHVPEPARASPRAAGVPGSGAIHPALRRAGPPQHPADDGVPAPALPSGGATGRRHQTRGAAAVRQLRDGFGDRPATPGCRVLQGPPIARPAWAGGADPGNRPARGVPRVRGRGGNRGRRAPLPRQGHCSRGAAWRAAHRPGRDWRGRARRRAHGRSSSTMSRNGPPGARPDYYVPLRDQERRLLATAAETLPEDLQIQVLPTLMSAVRAAGDAAPDEFTDQVRDDSGRLSELSGRATASPVLRAGWD